MTYKPSGKSKFVWLVFLGLLSSRCRQHLKSDVCYLSQFVMLTKEGQHRSSQYERWIKTSLISLRPRLRYWCFPACTSWSFHRDFPFGLFFKQTFKRKDNKSLSSVTLMFSSLAVPWLTVIIVFIWCLHGVLPHKCLSASLGSCYLYILLCLLMYLWSIPIGSLNCF